MRCGREIAVSDLGDVDVQLSALTLPIAWGRVGAPILAADV